MESLLNTRARIHTHTLPLHTHTQRRLSLAGLLWLRERLLPPVGLESPTLPRLPSLLLSPSFSRARSLSRSLSLSFSPSEGRLEPPPPLLVWFAASRSLALARSFLSSSRFFSSSSSSFRIFSTSFKRSWNL